MSTNNNHKVPVPRKLNQGMIVALSEYIRKGNYAVVACQLCGISEVTLWNWLNQAQQDEIAERETIYLALMKALKTAEAEAEALMVQTARDAAVAKKDGYLAITVNERRHPDRWGRRERKSIEITEHRIIEVTHIETVKDYGETQVIEAEKVKLLDNNTT